MIIDRVENCPRYAGTTLKKRVGNGLDSSAYGKHSLRYLGIEIDDAL